MSLREQFLKLYLVQILCQDRLLSNYLLYGSNSILSKFYIQLEIENVTLFGNKSLLL